MAEPFIGEIRAFGFNFAPRSWAQCDGQLLPISSNSALFSLLGTIYGGDGRTTFALPDLRGRSMVHEGHGPGLYNYQQGSRGGRESTTLSQAEMPPHSHTFNLGQAKGDKARGDGLNIARIIGDDDPNGGAGDLVYTATAPSGRAVLAPNSIGNTGGGQSFQIRGPYLTVNICIALQGVFPSRS